MRCYSGRLQELTDRSGVQRRSSKDRVAALTAGGLWHLTTSSFVEGFTSFHPAFIYSFLLSLALFSSSYYLVQSDYSALCKL